MKVYKENYGADIDGNRGIDMIMYELEDTDQEREEIAEILIGHGFTENDRSATEIEYMGVNIEIYVEEYSEEIKRLENGN